MGDIALSTKKKKPLITKDDLFAVSGTGRRDLTEMPQRFEALQCYLDLPIPDRVRHLWRYSDPAVFLPDSLEPMDKVTRLHRVDEGRGEGTEVRLVPFRDPIVTWTREAVKSGVTIEPLGASEWGLKRLGQAVAPDHGLFEALNGAIWSAGLFVNVPNGAKLTEPIRIVHRARPRLSATRIIVAVGESAEATIVEEYREGGDESLLLSVTELFVASGAGLHHLLVQNLGPGARGHHTSRALLNRDARLNTGLIHLGGRYYKSDVGAVLEGIGAQSLVAGVSLTDRRQHMDLHTVHHHTAERTRSNINFKSALSGRSESVYTGLIRIEAAAKLSEAFQENRNLMLSNRCRAEAIPELEIETNEVQCTHAATSAPIDESQLFYLKSRGIDESEATRMLVKGFFEKPLSLAPEKLRNETESAVDERLKQWTKGGVG